jgi:D-sedoheptulose 7-phosphate isomerase
MMEITVRVAEEIQECIDVKGELAQRSSEEIVEASKGITPRLRAGGKLVAFGNGGSAADTQHLVDELVGANAPSAALVMMGYPVPTLHRI